MKKWKKRRELGGMFLKKKEKKIEQRNRADGNQVRPNPNCVRIQI
jgi:hypothetical protein